jgi:hypothetical protein
VVIEEQLRLVELGAIGTILEIEVDGRRITQPLARQGRLAALTRPEQGQRGCSRESALQRLLGEAWDVSMHFDHGTC